MDTYYRALKGITHAKRNKMRTGAQRTVPAAPRIPATRLAKKTKPRKKTFKRKSVYGEKVKYDGTMSSTFHRWVNRTKPFRAPGFKQIMAPQFFVENAAANLTTAIGLQNFLSGGGPALFTPFDINAIYTQAASITASGLAVPNLKTQKVLIDSCTSELLITNATNDVVHLTIYDCVARRDIANASYWNPGQAWLTGATDQGNVAIPTYVGSNPFQTAAFTQFWIVEKVFDVNLHSGGHHRHSSKSIVNHIINDELVQEMPAASASYGKLTRYQFVVIHGYPLNDSTTKTQVSTAGVAIDMVWRKQYKYRILERSSTAFSAQNLLPGSFGVSGSIINDLTGAVTAVTQA